MNYEIIVSPTFEKEVKKLKKRYKKISFDLKSLITNLYVNPKLGTPLGNEIYKIRIPNSSIPTGKSGGFRVITYHIINEKIYLLTIYSKSDKESISSKEIENSLKEI